MNLYFVWDDSKLFISKAVTGKGRTMIIYYNSAVVIKTILVLYGMGILYQKGREKIIVSEVEKESWYWIVQG